MAICQAILPLFVGITAWIAWGTYSGGQGLGWGILYGLCLGGTVAGALLYYRHIAEHGAPEPSEQERRFCDSLRDPGEFQDWGDGP